MLSLSPTQTHRLLLFVIVTLHEADTEREYTVTPILDSVKLQDRLIEKKKKELRAERREWEKLFNTLTLEALEKYEILISKWRNSKPDIELGIK